MDEAVKTPMVSVIMPAYNAEIYIESSIQSIRDQTLTNWELIVVDDGSLDTTAILVKKLQANDHRIRYLYQRNKKLGAARNAGIKLATGEWLAFLDSDDLWMPDKLEKQLVAITGSSADVVFTNGYYLHEETGQLEPYDGLVGKFNSAEIYKLLFWHNRIAVLSVLIKKSLIDKIGLQDVSYKIHGCEDWDYWLRCCRAGATFLGLDYKSFKYRVHHEGMSRDVLNMRISGCYVLFKNYDASFFSVKEQQAAKERMVNEVRFIITTLYEKADIKRVPYLLQLFGKIYGSSTRSSIAILLVKLLKQKSKRFTLFFLYH